MRQDRDILITAAKNQPPKSLHDSGLYDLYEIVWSGELFAFLEYDGVLVKFTANNVISFRSQDEMDMVHYWRYRNEQGTPISSVYEVESSDLLSWAEEHQLSRVGDRLRHFVLSGLDQCLEFVGADDLEFRFEVIVAET